MSELSTNMLRGMLLATAIALVGCQKSAPPSPGEAYFNLLNCRACHKVGANGNAGGPDLTMVGFRHNKAWLDQWLAHPKGWKPDTLMPDPKLSPAARAALVDYLSTLQGQAFGGKKPWEGLKGVERGHAIFAKAGCVACHGLGGRGGSPNNNVAGGKIPSLLNVADTYSKEELVRKIKFGSAPQKADPAGPEPLVFMPKWGQVLKDDEIEDVAAYVLSLKASKPAGGDW